jgi:hypothetical protein
MHAVQHAAWNNVQQDSASVAPAKQARTHKEDGVCCLVAVLDACWAGKAGKVAANEGWMVLQGAQQIADAVEGFQAQCLPVLPLKQVVL